MTDERRDVAERLTPFLRDGGALGSGCAIMRNGLARGSETVTLVLEEVEAIAAALLREFVGREQLATAERGIGVLDEARRALARQMGAMRKDLEGRRDRAEKRATAKASDEYDYAYFRGMADGHRDALRWLRGTPSDSPTEERGYVCGGDDDDFGCGYFEAAVGSDTHVAFCPSCGGHDISPEREASEPWSWIGSMPDLPAPCPDCGDPMEVQNVCESCGHREAPPSAEEVECEHCHGWGKVLSSISKLSGNAKLIDCIHCCATPPEEASEGEPCEHGSPPGWCMPCAAPSQGTGDAERAWLRHLEFCQRCRGVIVGASCPKGLRLRAARDNALASHGTKGARRPDTRT